LLGSRLLLGALLLLLRVRPPIALLRLALALLLIGTAIALVTPLRPTFGVAAFAATAGTATRAARSSLLVATRVTARLAARTGAGVTVATAFPIASTTITRPVAVASWLFTCRRGPGGWRDHRLRRPLVAEQPVPQAHEGAIAWTVLRYGN
jgi:hypothetical protein